MSLILAGLIKKQITEDCVETTELNCGSDGATSNSIEPKLKIEFPSHIGQTLPLIGGAVVSFDMLNMKIVPSPNFTNIIEKDLADLSKLQLRNKLEDLNKAHLSVNAALFNISRKNLNVVNEDPTKNPKKVKAPSIYISIFKGEDSSNLEDGIANPDLIRLVEFKFLPKEVFKEITSNLLENEDGFEATIGLAGKSFKDLESAAQRTDNIGNKTDIIDLVLEFFPVVNISEDTISKNNSNPTIGGYYTIYDGRAYFKTPDLSGRNSAGQSSGLIKSDSELFIEVLSAGELSRAAIDDFRCPPLASFVGSPPSDFPGFSSLEIEMEITEELSGLTVYLSPLFKNATIPKKRSIDSYSDYVEIFSAPLLTKGIEPGRKAILGETSSPNLIENLEKVLTKLDAYFPGFSTSFTTSTSNLENLGFPFMGQTNDSAHAFFGEKNRPEIILTNVDKINSVKKNDSRYYGLSSYGALEILSSIAPKFYNPNTNIPSEWISARPTTNSDGNLIAKFPSFHFSDLDLNSSELNGSIAYAVYIGDGLGQITRVAGPPMELFQTKPFIDSISPNGYFDSTPLDISQSAELVISGEDFGDVQVVEFEATSGTIISIAKGDSRLTISGNTINVLFSDSLSSEGFIADQVYLVRLIGSNVNLTSSDESIYITSDPSAVMPRQSALLASFGDDEITSLDFGTNPIIGIPLLKSGDSAEIRFKSKSKIFKGNRDVYAYLALPDGANGVDQVLSQIALPSKVKSFTSSKLNAAFKIPINMEYGLEQSLVADFRKVSNTKASIKFPGSRYSNINLSGLKNIEEAYILFTSRRIAEVSGTDDLFELDSDEHHLVKLGNLVGDNIGPAFIEPYVILGHAFDIGSGIVVSNFVSTDYPATTEFDGFDCLDIFGVDSITPGTVNAFGTLSRIAVLVSGVTEKLQRNRYTFMLGSEDITSKISRSPKNISKDTILFVFDNVKPKTVGLLPLIVEKNDKIFKIKTNSGTVTTQTSAIIASAENYTIDERTQALTTNRAISEITENLESAISFLDGFVGTVDNSIDLIFPATKSGISYDLTPSQEFRFFNSPVNITTSADLKIGIDSQDADSTDSFFSGIMVKDVRAAALNSLSLSSGSSFLTSAYSLDSDGNAIVYFNTKIANPVAIKYMVPEVVAIGIATASDLTDLSSGEVVPLIVGEKYKVKVKNTDRDFVVKFGEFVLNPRGRPEPALEDGVYIATVEIPVTMLGQMVTNGKCFDVCASTANADRNRAKAFLGRDFVVDLDKVFNDVLFGPLKDKIPDVQEIIEKIKNFPLKFLNINLDKALIPKELIKSFCDFSFHLSAELKIILNGFSILMIPIQVILCIIDVICSLLNPVKTAKAIIRLFQCLYDLILLLPQISIPVMFFQLILHLLELIQCVIDKVLFTVTAINEIGKAISLAIKQQNFPAIKALEEVLSEYLFDLETDLQFLEPILSILAIFLQLLQLTFRFPCNVDPGAGEPDCGIDGTMLGGIVAGIAAPDLVVLAETLIPVGQAYSTAANGSTESGSVTLPVAGNIIATKTGETSFIDSLSIDADSLRATTAGTGNIDFNTTFAPTFTKSKKKAGDATLVEFQFKDRGSSTGLNSKNIDPNQTIDAPLFFMGKGGSQLSLEANGNLYSPLDGKAFLNINGDKASVKSLTIELEVPIITTDANGLPVQSGTDIVERTFDRIPMLALMDDEFNVYFIENDGISFNNDGQVESIWARVVNTVSATKMKFSKEDEEIDTDDDGVMDDELKIFDFPQLYFFDMRQASELIEQFCSQASINSFLFDSAETNDTNEIETIVESAQSCLEEYLVGIRDIVAGVRTAQITGVADIPLIDLTDLTNLNDSVRLCLNQSVDDICKFVINSLNTSFKIDDDILISPLANFTDGDLPESALESFDSLGPSFTGAREYAAGIGDSATISVNSTAKITIIPRDSFDEEIIGDLTDKILLEIISDDGGNAKFNLNSDGNIITKDGVEYHAELTSSVASQVKIRAKICDRTIQALTFAGIEDVITTTVDADCIPDVSLAASNVTPPIGALTKVDRILTVYFINSSNVIIDNSGKNGGEFANTNPQEFGTGLEN